MNKQSIKDIYIYCGIILFVILLRCFVITPVRVNGTSMYPTLKNKEIMILDKISYRFNDIKRFDIVVIKYQNELLVKRVIGFPGETIEYIDNKLYVNGKLITEKFLNDKTFTNDFSITSLGYTKIPNNCYIVLGDNREDSLDSRYFGCFNKKQIKGKTSLVIFPFSDFGNKN